MKKSFLGEEVSIATFFPGSFCQANPGRNKIDRVQTDILILSPSRTRPSPVITPKPLEVQSEYLHILRSRTYIFKQPLLDLKTAVPSPLPRVTPLKVEGQSSERSQQTTAMVLNVTPFSGSFSTPRPLLPRKPRRQSVIGKSILNIIYNNGVK